MHARSRWVITARHVARATTRYRTCVGAVTAAHYMRTIRRSKCSFRT